MVGFAGCRNIIVDLISQVIIIVILMKILFCLLFGIHGKWNSGDVLFLEACVMGYTCDSSRLVLWDIHVIPRGLCYGIYM